MAHDLRENWFEAALPSHPQSRKAASRKAVSRSLDCRESLSSKLYSRGWKTQISNAHPFICARLHIKFLTAILPSLGGKEIETQRTMGLNQSNTPGS